MCLFLFRICAFSNMFQLCSKVLTVSRWIVTHALIPDSGSGSVHKFPSILSLRAPNGGQALQPRFFPRESNSLTRFSSHWTRAFCFIQGSSPGAHWSCTQWYRKLFCLQPWVCWDTCHPADSQWHARSFVNHTSTCSPILCCWCVEIR